MDEGDIQSRDELIATLRDFVCQCGYAITDEDACFYVDEERCIVLACPSCGDEWRACPIKVN